MNTSHKSQQAMFLQNLWREMEKLSYAPNKSLYKVAHQYLSDGYEAGEVIELLVSDGFDSQSARNYIQSLAYDEKPESGDEPEWGFEAENQQTGDVVSNFDLNCSSVVAIDESDAMEKSQAIIDGMGADSYLVIRVKKTCE